MIFVNSSILFALTAVLIPVIIHLFNLRKVRKIEFSTLMFLKDIRKSKFKRIRIKQLILLFIRILIITSIVLAFSNPVIEGYNALGSGNSQKSAIIILDNSFSMDIKDATGSNFEKSKSIVNDILSQFTENDNITFLLSSQITQKDFQIMQLPLSKIKEALSNSKNGYKIFYYSELKTLIDKFDSFVNNRTKEYFIVSDFRKPNFTEIDNLAVANSQNSQIFLVNSSDRNGDNISIDEVVLKSKFVFSESNIRVSVKVTNHSSNAVFNKIIRLYTDDKLAQEIAVDLNNNESKNVDFNFRQAKTGSLKCRIELSRDDYSKDELGQDNNYYFVINIPEVVRLGVLGDYNSESYKYIQLAINAANNITSDSSGGSKPIFHLSNISPLSSVIKTDVLIINDKRNFTENEKILIKSYLTEGKGVLIFPSKDLDVDNYNSLFYSLDMFSLNKSINHSSEKQPGLAFKKIDYSHPVFEGIFKKGNTLENNKPEFESPQINMYWSILPELNSYPLITLSNNNVFLSESNYQKGKLMFYSVSANTDMSKFPMTGLFPSVLIRSLQYLSGDINENIDYQIGKTNVITANDIKKIDYYTTPDNSKVPFSVNFEKTVKEKEIAKNYFSFPFTSQTEYPGFYQFNDSASGKNIVAALNPDFSEGDLTLVNKKEITGYFEKIGFKNVKYIENHERIKNEINSLRNGLELWKYFLLFSVLLIMLEIYYSRRVEKS